MLMHRLYNGSQPAAAFCDAQTMTSAALVALAEDPEFFTQPPEGASRLGDERFCVVVGPQRRWAGVSRVRLGAEPRLVAEAVADVRDIAEGIDLVLWNVGSSATPADLPEQLRGLGLRDPEKPMEPVVAALALEEEPPPVSGIEVRRIETLEEHRMGLEVMLAASSHSEEAAADERRRAEETFERRQRRGGFQWLAWLDGEPVGFGAADRAEAGLFLAGGSTLPAARGRGCYRALVRARWETAAELGTPGLAVQAQYATSYPILRRLGFVEVATVHTLLQ
jgi:GNAT superfamily N-acetyltransferase